MPALPVKVQKVCDVIRAKRAVLSLGSKLTPAPALGDGTFAADKLSTASQLTPRRYNSPSSIMLTRRRTRLITALFALLSLLFMQLAVASYACPGAASKVAAMADARMPCVEPMSLNMDDAQPNLCHAHCQTGQQTADKYELPSLPTVALIGPGFTLAATIRVFSGAPLQVPDLKRATAPPVVIRNCCFRI